MAISITSETRTLSGRSTDQLRVEGKVPAIVYGFEIEPIKITIDRNEFNKLYSEAGESTIIDLKIGDDSHNVLIQEIQRDALTDFVVHADFRCINMNEAVETTIPVTLTGECQAVKELGGTLIQTLDAVDVKALPSVLVREFMVSVEVLDTFDDVIRVSDIKVGEGMEILTAESRTVASVMPPRTQEEMDALDAEVDADVSQVEVDGEAAEDGEEGETPEGEEKAEEKPAEEKAE